MGSFSRHRARTATASDIAPTDRRRRARGTPAESVSAQRHRSGLADGFPASACGPYVFSPDAFKIVADALGRDGGVAQRALARRLELVVALRSATALRRWIGQPRGDEPFVFEPIERR